MSDETKVKVSIGPHAVIEVDLDQWLKTRDGDYIRGYTDAAITEEMMRRGMYPLESVPTEELIQQLVGRGAKHERSVDLQRDENMHSLLVRTPR